MRTTTNRWIAGLAVLGLAVGAVACGDEQADVEAATIADVEVLGDGEVKAHLTTADQETDGNLVSVPEVTVLGDGAWLVIHIDEGGDPGPVLGHVWLDEGTHLDVPVILEHELGGEVTLWAALYEDEAGGHEPFDIRAETPIVHEGVPFAEAFRTFFTVDVDGDVDVDRGDETVVHDNDTTVVHEDDDTVVVTD